uniref:CLAVATA3/ESR (CLE)-related protein 45 n=1 Tax=Nelumbo nucifera TaxID=4432 RepID=A0A822YTZ6_NELNU|nr:TPA_asm: hypothetical protein HUJ06_005519 [Nelumbo nucifera]
MVFCAYRMFVLVICIGFLVVQPQKVSGLSSIDLVLRWKKEEQALTPKNSRFLAAVEVEELNTKKKSVSPSSRLDPNRSSKRRVRRGSDPIHNRC